MGWIGVDLDGTLAEYHGWPVDGSVGPPVPAMVDRVKRWLDDGHEVRIVTARVCVNGRFSAESGRVASATFGAGLMHTILQWCLQHLGVELVITCEKDFEMEVLWDDRCVQVECNTGRMRDGGPP